jgi:hypothetical protein
MKSNYYIEYPLQKERFSETDLRVVSILMEAGKKIGELFARQVEFDNG